MEQVLADASKAYDFKVLCLRYFNPIGADPQLRTGQDQLNGHHVLAKLLQAHTFGHPFYVTGCEWPTRDGSGIRDYIHVWDLAMAHVKAVDSLLRMRGENVFEIVNLGSRSGTTVLELVEAFQKVTGTQLRLEKKPARPGDVAGAFASCDKAKNVLGWSSTLSLEDSIRSALEWSKVEKQRLKK
jgi:UDP-glucose 4-epimerase